MPTETFTSDGSVDIPTGVSEVEVLLRGAPGEDGSGETATGDPSPTGSGGSGYEIEGVLSVSGGDTLYVRIGGRGLGGFVSDIYTGTANAGDGGDAADIRINGTALSDRAAVAGAGAGGGAGAEDRDTAGDGGDAGLSSGESGTPDFSGAEGGTQSSGGAGNGLGTAGGPGTGGDGSESDEDGVAGGGGGAGYYGGGGAGAIGTSPGGGGGGSSYTGGLSTVTSTQSNTDPAYVEISYEAPPGEITDLSAVASGKGQIDLSFTPADNADDHNVYRSTEPGVTTSDQLAGTTVDGSFTDTDLLDGTEYYYRVGGTNSVGEGPLSNEANEKTILPAPVDLTATSVGTSVVSVSWDATHDNGETRVETRPTGETAWGDAAPGGAETTVAFDVESATLTGLRNGEAYDARVVAVTDDAERVDK